MRGVWAALVLALMAIPALAQDLPALFRVQGVAAGDVLNIRAEPSVRAAILGGLAPDATGVEVTALSEDGRWGRVNSGEGSGWAAMRYLQALPGPGWQSGEVGLRCLGTEPFWNLDIFLPTHHAEFFEPGSGGFELVTDTGRLPRTAFPQTLAVPFGGMREGMAVLRRAECSDGMSDRSFGIEAQIYWRGQTEGLSGCCTLMP